MLAFQNYLPRLFKSGISFAEPGIYLGHEHFRSDLRVRPVLCLTHVLCEQEHKYRKVALWWD